MQPDYFANHERARKFPWTLYHAPLERDLASFLDRVTSANGAYRRRVMCVGCGLMQELDTAPDDLELTVVDIDPRAVAAVMAKKDPHVVAGCVVPPEDPIDLHEDLHDLDAIYAKEVIEHVLAWPAWLAGLRRMLRPGGTLWLSTPNYGEPWLPAIESTVLELVARRSGFTRRHMHPTRFSRASLARGLRGAGFVDVETHVTPTRLAITAWAKSPRRP